jgi:hypothetical protein
MSMSGEDVSYSAGEIDSPTGMLSYGFNVPGH